MTLKEIKNALCKNHHKIADLNSFFKSIGIDIVNHKSITPNSYIETPTRIYRGTVTGSEIGAFSYIGREAYIYDTIIKRYCSIARGVTIGQGNHPYSWLSSNPFQYQQSFRIQTGELFKYHDEYSTYFVSEKLRKAVGKEVRKEKTIIGNDVWIGTGVIILPGISIGDGAVIGAGSIVTKNIPPYAIAVGNPAKVIKYRFPKEIILRLQNLQWWMYSPWDMHKNKIVFNDVEYSIARMEELINSGDLKKYDNQKVKIQDIIDIYNECKIKV